MNEDPRIIVALDYDNKKQLLRMIERLDPNLCKVKIGYQSFIVGGPKIVERAVMQGFDVLLDLKLHDIPSTARKAVVEMTKLKVWGATLHASGGREMMLDAWMGDSNEHKIKFFAVTALTSLDDGDVKEIAGPDATVFHMVTRLTQLAENSAMTGIVCSPHEAAQAKSRSFLETVCPGIRLPGVEVAEDDQKRTMTPGQAVAAGADYLVIGRPITKAKKPNSALWACIDDINS